MNDFEPREVAQTPETPETPELDVAKLVEELKAKGLGAEEIKKAFEDLKQEGKLSDEEYAKALQLIEEDDKAEASKLFGVDLM